MTQLQRDALATTPMTAEAVHLLHGGAADEATGVGRAIRRLCISHERLRAELDGLAALHADDERRVAVLVDSLKKAELWIRITLGGDPSETLNGIRAALAAAKPN